MSFGVDYSFHAHPSISSLLSARVTFVMRYTSANPDSDTNGKNLTASEKSALLNAGIKIGIVKEEGAERMLRGYSAGVTDARQADAAVSALGLDGIPIYFACDFDATERDQTAINAYLDGAASVIGLDRVGIYGGYYPVGRALDAGKATWAWQTYAWSGGLWDSRAQLQQYLNGQTIGGASVDYDRSEASDYGQWPRPNPQPTEEEDDMSMLANGYNQMTVEVFRTADSISTVMLASDNTYYNAPRPKLRVAWHDNSTGSWRVNSITLPNSDKAYANAPPGYHANIVTIVRNGNDAGDDVPVAYRLY